MITDIPKAMKRLTPCDYMFTEQTFSEVYQCLYCRWLADRKT